MEEEDEKENKEAQTLFFLGMKKAATLELGCSPLAKVLKMPINQTPTYTDSFCDFLSHNPCSGERGPPIGPYSETNNGICYEHTNFRNRFCMKGNYLFESSGASIHIVHDPVTDDNWSIVSPSISTRSICTSISLNPLISFGVAVTKKDPVIFGITHNPVTRFIRADGISFDIPVCEGSTNSLMEGESIFVTNDGEIFLYDQDRLVSRTGEILDEEYNEASVSFGLHPRVVAGSSKEYVRIYDFRLKDPCGGNIVCAIPNVSSIMPVDSNQMAVASMSGLNLIDMRFPTQSGFHFEYMFTAPPMSLQKKTIDNYSCIVAQCPKSSEVVFFPFSRYEFVAPIRPFDIAVQEYTTEEQEYLTGIAVPDDLVYLQFERGSVIVLELSRDCPPCKHYFSSVMRGQTETPKDIFEFKPKFEKLNMEDSKPKPNWGLLFPEMSEHPPSCMLYDPPEAEEVEDPGSSGYLCQVDGALDLDEDDVPVALSLFWKNHLNIARSAT